MKREPAPRVLLVAGARPNFIKIAAIYWAACAAGVPVRIVHTGQHYDASLSDAFFADLAIPPPDHHLEVGSASHATQTARIMERFEPVLVEERPDWVVVVGDVNSTLACALVAAKLKWDLGCNVAHVEAGLRSGDWRMPEEVNRVLTDRLSDLLLVPSRDAIANLETEGISGDRVEFAGNVMIDSLLRTLNRPWDGGGLDLPERYAVVTLHRPSLVDDPTALAAVVEGLNRLAREIPIVFPVHPRTRGALAGPDAPQFGDGVLLLPPLGYQDMTHVVGRAAAVLTDSGGLQEETTALGIPCLTLREQTERPITIQQGTNRLVDWPMTGDAVLRGGLEALSRGSSHTGERPEGWDGHAAERVVAALVRKRNAPRLAS
jgi:UDP-N-acetylglucosamine 2-epimerase (non-hydrolysing)